MEMLGVKQGILLNLGVAYLQFMKEMDAQLLQ
ncbi:hypothetical protein SDC9_151657 [bioreactor metagenome]|uniref:Uncharacterized protein n=1 Tax=bioreactor metagenome TaxID=1076179 RepID=A0A645ET88_9ZZZZ